MNLQSEGWLVLQGFLQHNPRKALPQKKRIGLPSVTVMACSIASTANTQNHCHCLICSAQNLPVLLTLPVASTATMADGLFGAADESAAPQAKEERRTKLYPYDSVAALMLEPFGESAVDTMSLAQVWSGTVKGSKRAAYHSHLAASQEKDAWHVGAGISLTAAALLASIKNLKSSDMKKIIVPTLYDKVMQEAKTLEPTLEALNFGKGSATAAPSSSFRDAKRMKTTATTSVTGTSGASIDPEQAAKNFRAWLAQEKSPLRSMLFILAGNNAFYTGHVAELVARAAVACKPMTEEDFVGAVKARMQKPAETPAAGAASSDATGLFDA